MADLSRLGGFHCSRYTLIALNALYIVSCTAASGLRRQFQNGMYFRGLVFPVIGHVKTRRPRRPETNSVSRRQCAVLIITGNYRYRKLTENQAQF